MNTPTSNSRADQGRLSRTLLLILLFPCLLLSAGTVAFSMEEVTGLFPEARDSFFESREKPNCVARKGMLLVLGRFSGSGFAIEKISQLRLLGPGDQVIPLTIDESRLWRDALEGNKITSLDFCFEALAEQLQTTPEKFRFQWGEDIDVKNHLLPRIIPDSSARQNCREFVPAVAETSSGLDSQNAELIIIADTSADYYFLWYLVPMGTIFVLLTIRKYTPSSSRNSTDGK